MERFGITVEDLKCWPVPTISNILNDLVLDMFKVDKLVSLVAKICVKALYKASVISKLYKLV